MLNRSSLTVHLFEFSLRYLPLRFRQNQLVYVYMTGDTDDMVSHLVLPYFLRLKNMNELDL